MLNYRKIPLNFLKFDGSDRLDLINRLSTNKVDNLAKLKGAKTVLTSDKGRFIDLLTLYNFGDFVFSACSLNNSSAVITHLDKYTIMDDFKVTDVTGTHETILFYGDDTGKFIKELFNIDINGFSNNDFEIFIEDERHSVIAKNDDAFGGILFMYEVKDSGFYHKKLLEKEQKDKFSLKEISDDEFEFERIKLGIPKFGSEMTGETNPLECGLNKYVSFTKGCYIGQEVIARLDTYDKISKHLVILDIANELPPGLKPGEAKISVDDKECGFVTSCISAKVNGNFGLGFVKTAFLDFEKPYKIKYYGNEINCRLIKIN
jgi:folate-binding protein YgfZ